MSENILLSIYGLFIVSSFLAIILTFYIGRARIKEIDKIVYGYEFPNDSIFALMLRVPNYAGAFICKWCAKRSGLEGKVEQFDKQFRWPFIATFFLSIFSVVCLIIGTIFQNYVGL